MIGRTLGYFSEEDARNSVLIAQGIEALKALKALSSGASGDRFDSKALFKILLERIEGTEAMGDLDRSRLFFRLRDILDGIGNTDVRFTVVRNYVGRLVHWYNTPTYSQIFFLFFLIPIAFALIFFLAVISHFGGSFSRSSSGEREGLIRSFRQAFLLSSMAVVYLFSSPLNREKFLEEKDAFSHIQNRRDSGIATSLFLTLLDDENS